MLLCIVVHAKELEDCCETQWPLRFPNRWKHLEDTTVFVIPRKNADFHSTVRDHCWTSKPCLRWGLEVVRVVDWPVSLLKLSTDDWKKGLLSLLWSMIVLLLSDFNYYLFFTCVHACERWKMDFLLKAPVERDVKAMTSIKSVYFLLWDESKRKSLEIRTREKERRKWMTKQAQR